MPLTSLLWVAFKELEHSIGLRKAISMDFFLNKLESIDYSEKFLRIGF